MKLVVYGTRPEEIKLWPFTQYQGYSFLQVNQSKDLHQGLITPDYVCEEVDLGMMLREINPSTVIVQGDTRTAFRAARKAFEAGIPVAHVEAGLRTWDLKHPFPEEGYRRMIDEISTYHFCPTPEALENVKHHKNTRVVGNTAIDTLLAHAPEPTESNIVLVTCHRREANVEGIAEGLNVVAKMHPGYRFRLVTHPNETSAKLQKLVSFEKLPPMEYKTFVKHLAMSHAVLTDSGGLQEEAPSLNKPVIILRNVTERPEGIKSGCALVGGMNKETIVDAFHKMQGNYEYMARSLNPYGDGQAARRIDESISSRN